jgi:hypothetical protein
MATLGVITYEYKKALFAKDAPKIRLIWEKESHSITGNYTTIKWIYELYVVTDVTLTTRYTITIDGVEYKRSYENTFFHAGWNTLEVETQDIQHNADGTKTLAYSFEETYDAVHPTASGLDTVDPIPRPATILTAPNFNDDADPTITYSNPSGLTNLEACIANDIGTVIYVPYREIDPEETSYTFELTDEERQTLLEAAEGNTLSVRFYIKSVAGGGTHYRFLKREMAVSKASPTFVDPEAYDTNSKTTRLTGDSSVIIPGFSNIYYYTGATPQKESTITSQRVKCGSQVLHGEEGTFTAVESNEVEISATDNRGNTGYHTIHLTLIPYFKVTCNQSVKLNENGTADLVITGNYFDGSFGDEDNTLTVQIRHREDGGEWEDWATLDPLISEISDDTYTLTATISGYDPSGTHEFQSCAFDRLYKAYSSEDSIVLKPIFDWSRHDFNFNVPLTIEGDPLADYIIETGTEAMGSNGTWYWTKWKSGKAECYGCRNYGNMAFYDTGIGFYHSNSFTQKLPPDLFDRPPEIINITVMDSPSGPCFVMRGAVDEAGSDHVVSKDYTDGFKLMSLRSGTFSQVKIGFNAIGRWY